MACRIFVAPLTAAHGLVSSCSVRVFSSLVVAHEIQSSWALYMRHASSVVVAHGLGCPAACGILFP